MHLPGHNSFYIQRSPGSVIVLPAHLQWLLNSRGLASRVWERQCTSKTNQPTFDQFQTVSIVTPYSYSYSYIYCSWWKSKLYIFDYLCLCIHTFFESAHQAPFFSLQHTATFHRARHGLSPGWIYKFTPQNMRFEASKSIQIPFQIHLSFMMFDNKILMI